MTTPTIKPAGPGYLLIPVEGPTQVLDVPTPDQSLAALQFGVGGYVECVEVDASTLVGRPAIDMWLNEEGKFNGMQPNDRAQYLWVLTHGHTDIMMGPVVLTATADDQGETHALGEDDITSIRATFDMLGWEA